MKRDVTNVKFYRKCDLRFGNPKTQLLNNSLLNKSPLFIEFSNNDNKLVLVLRHVKGMAYLLQIIS
jgi:hypothetical protein